MPRWEIVGECAFNPTAIRLQENINAPINGGNQMALLFSTFHEVFLIVTLGDDGLVDCCGECGQRCG